MRMHCVVIFCCSINRGGGGGGGGGNLVERWVLFRPLRFTNGLFYLKIGLDIGGIFQNKSFSMYFSFSLPICCQKVLMHANLHGKKY